MTPRHSSTDSPCKSPVSYTFDKRTMTTPGAGCAHCSALQAEVAELRAINAQLRSQVEALQKSAARESNTPPQAPQEANSGDHVGKALQESICSPFSKLELQRYGRQMLVKEFGVAAQLKLRAARVLVIGAGGLGSPVAMYLAAMGVGTLGIVDDDRVDRSNLHRQVLHDEQAARQQEKKVISAQRRVQELNPLVRCVAYDTRFTAANALELVEAYDVVVDASDNVGTRYLVNDACARLQKPLVSGSALGLEGQVTVFTYNKDDNATGCYRCLYPTPPRVARSCADNGVLGVVPGVIGCAQAMETVKVISGVGEALVGVQCFYDAYDGKFRHLKIAKKRNPNCQSCGERCDKSLSPVSGLLVEGVCADTAAHAADVGSEFHISVEDFAKLRESASPEGNTPNTYGLLDTRAPNQFEMVHFPEAVNIPFAQLIKRDPAQVVQRLLEDKRGDHLTVFVICRRGVDSMRATRWLVGSGLRDVRNVDGGYTEYAKREGVHPEFPMY